MRTESVKSPLATMGVAVMAVMAACASDVKDDFESSVSAGWTGNYAVSNNVGSYAQTPPGAPIADVNHTKMLSIAGTAARSYSGDGDVSGNRVVDLLVMAEEMPDEELPEGSADDQVKFAFDTNGCINLYHKRPGEDTAQWSKLSDKVYANGQWVRVSFGFDYGSASKRCQLKVDGSPLVSDYGYRSASGSETPGSWYNLANQTATELVAIDFVGCGGVDDVVNAVASTYTPSTGATTATNGVDFAWFDKNGIAWCDPNNTDAPGNSGYTVKQAFDTGIDPYSDNKLYVTNASYDSSNLVLTFNGYGKDYVVETSTDPFTDGTRGTSAGGTFTPNEGTSTTTWTGSFPAATGITYYRVRNNSAITAETVNQFAIMKVVSTNANTLVALPWRALGVNTNSPTAVTVANVVMSKNLVNGDYLLYYNGGYKGWVFSSGSWTPVSAVTTNGTLVVAPPGAVSLERGQAIWIVRTTANGRDLNDPFYLYGQYDANSVSTEVPAGGALLANPKQGAFTVSSRAISNAANGDEIRVPLSDNTMPKVIKYDGGWKEKVSDTATIEGPPGAGNITTGSTRWEAVDYPIPEGQGFMYIRKSSTGTAPTVNW